ncbi:MULTISPECIES: glycosyltransferase family 2 protein [unclassified Massilia]|uniref:glycosyltransferase family 2 protein n=1 Tax=unclassified Massilia TaxID=2609279 RepID=UPI00177C3CD1|nr:MULTISPECIES: glycosyltransferase family 2 protein [unclassified Massilia]MBD8531354.1 glycosyltransferase family 2 protein [Massilia sp. CFBP 13647]MBD8674391.1 glycosyltransferase family 2 protein [Massilia sp. CFBP 13721]
MPSISVVAPAYNEQEVLGEFHRRVTEVLAGLGCDYEIVLVNDGSRDNTLALMHALRERDPHVTVVDLSRNFGKEIALSAGLDHTKGEVVVILDSDLQDPPELIPEMLASWRLGYDVVYGVRTQRDGETWFKKLTAKYFYRLIKKISRVNIPTDTGDFRLMTRRAVDAVGKLREEHRFMKGLFAWIGFPSIPVFYRRDPRAAGTTTWNYWNLWNFALEGITSFTVAPLKVATYLGLSVAVLALLYAAFVVWKALMFSDPVQGYPSLMAAMLFLGGVQLISIGLLGEYVGRIFNEVKQRPLYLVNRLLGSDLRDARLPDSGKTP